MLNHFSKKKYVLFWKSLQQNINWVFIKIVFWYKLTCKIVIDFLIKSFLTLLFHALLCICLISSRTQKLSESQEERICSYYLWFPHFKHQWNRWTVYTVMTRTGDKSASYRNTHYQLDFGNTRIPLPQNKVFLQYRAQNLQASMALNLRDLSGGNIRGPKDSFWLQTVLHGSRTKIHHYRKVNKTISFLQLIFLLTASWRCFCLPKLQPKKMSS